MNSKDVRRLALALPEVNEAPHFHLASFRVTGKIFATMPQDGSYLNVFVDDAQREMMLAVDPKAYDNVLWAKKIAGLPSIQLWRARNQFTARAATNDGFVMVSSGSTRPP